MSNLSREQLKALLRFGVHIAKLDGDFNVWERKLLARLADSIQLSEEDKQDLINEHFSLGAGLRIFDTDESQVVLLKTLCAVSQIDGEVTDAELEFVQRVLGQISAKVFLLARSDWAQYVDEVNSLLDEL